MNERMRARAPHEIDSVVLNARLHAVDPHLNPNAALNRELRAKASSETLAHLSSALLYGLQGVFLTIALIAAVTFVVAWFFPKGMASEHQHSER